MAAIDCGTNSTRLLVVDGDGTVLERHMRITRLGEGVDATHTLSRDAVARTVSVLGDYRALMDRHGVVRARLVATSAARDATNAEEFLVGRARGHRGAARDADAALEEGALSFAGATAHVARRRLGPGPVLVVDIGGGSTELVAGEPRAAGAVAGGRCRAVSLDVGCVRVTERFFAPRPAAPRRAGRGPRARSTPSWPTARARAPAPGRGGPAHRAGRHGVDAGRAGAGGVADYERAAIHHVVLDRATVAHWLETLAGEDSRARLARPGMVEGRADVIVGGVLILDAVMDAFDRTQCLVSEDDILDGLVASLL